MKHKKLKYAPRWIVFFIDVCFSVGAALGAALIVVNFHLDSIDWRTTWTSLLIVAGVRILSFIIGRTYSGIVRYTGAQDVTRIFLILTIGEAVILTFNLIWDYATGDPLMPYPFAVIEYGLLLFAMIMSRLVFKSVWTQVRDAEKPVRGVVIYGSDEYAEMVMKVLDNSVDTRYSVKAFIDSEDNRAGKKLAGVPIHRLSSLKEILRKGDADLVIIAQKIVPTDVKNEIIDTAMPLGATVSEIPGFEKLIDGTLTVSQIRNIRIEDLLNRGVIEMDNDTIREQVDGKCILVTGAAGSIGSELVRQLAQFRPKRVIMFDSAETPLYELELEVRENMLFNDFRIELGNIRDQQGVDTLFNRYRPDVVYHAAAYKHVPMIENMPLEGVKTNVLGTRHVADAALRFGCSRFVMVSTDKAVNPTNVMGATKRIAEIYIQSLNGQGKTRFITTRFGNVLGSTGSVIPRFARQIEAGGPVTVTHPEITRFFMTIPEACRLVLQAGALGEGGEIFAFDMGKSVKILDLARNMIRLSGYEVDKDIKIIFTGLRPGEKLYEEVLDVGEEHLPTPHKLIFRAKVREYPAGVVAEWIGMLESAVAVGNSFKVIRIMKEIVPEYYSNNSVYEQIDIQLREERTEVLDK